MSILNLEEMLGQSLASVEAAPNYVQLETGLYIMEVVDSGLKVVKRDPKKAAEDGKDPEYAQLSHTYKVIEVVQTEGNVVPVQAGSLTTDTWLFGETGLPHFKARTIDIAVANGEDAAEIGALTVRDQLEGVKGMQFKVAVVKQERRDSPGYYNTRYNSISKAE